MARLSPTVHAYNHIQVQVERFRFVEAVERRWSVADEGRNERCKFGGVCCMCIKMESTSCSLLGRTAFPVENQ